MIPVLLLHSPHLPFVSGVLTSLTSCLPGVLIAAALPDCVHLCLVDSPLPLCNCVVLRVARTVRQAYQHLCSSSSSLFKSTTPCYVLAFHEVLCTELCLASSTSTNKTFVFRVVRWSPPVAIHDRKRMTVAIEHTKSVKSFSCWLNTFFLTNNNQFIYFSPIYLLVY